MKTLNRQPDLYHTKKTRHFQLRANQRAITADMLELVYYHGIVDHGDRTTLNKQAAQQLLDALISMQKTLKKIIDKGGVALVETDGKLITTFRTRTT
jgi:hypothetical protein